MTKAEIEQKVSAIREKSHAVEQLAATCVGVETLIDAVAELAGLAEGAAILLEKYAEAIVYSRENVNFT